MSIVDLDRILDELGTPCQIVTCPREVIIKADLGFKKQPGPTPNFIRELFREDALVAREVLRMIMLGGLELTEEGARVASDQALQDLGCTLTVPMQMATLGQRIDAAKAIIQTGVGFKTDHTTDDEPLRRAVVLFPEWQDRKSLKPPAKGALTSGEADESDNGGRKKARARNTTPRRKPGSGRKRSS